jgi:multisubunit Na+/H+ antiporter MnhG subunit
VSHPLAVEILLAIAFLVALASCIGMAVMHDAYQRLHYLAPAASISPVLIMVAVLLEEGVKQAGIKAILVAAVTFVMNAVLSHATARAFRIRELGQLLPRPEQQAGVPVVGVDVEPEKVLPDEEKAA